MLEASRTKKSTEEEKSETSFNNQLSTLYLFHWCAEFAKDKVRLIMRGRKMDLYLILSWFWTVILTSVVYSLEYFALYKINPESFIMSFVPNYFSFLGFSFGTLTTSSISTIEASSTLATLLCYTELACSIIILFILIFTVLTAARERYKEDIENILDSLGDIAFILQESSQRLFNLALADAEMILVEHNQSLINGLRKLRGLPEIQPQTEDAKDDSQNS